MFWREENLDTLLHELLLNTVTHFVHVTITDTLDQLCINWIIFTSQELALP